MYALNKYLYINIINFKILNYYYYYVELFIHTCWQWKAKVTLKEVVHLCIEKHGHTLECPKLDYIYNTRFCLFTL